MSHLQLFTPIENQTTTFAAGVAAQSVTFVTKINPAGPSVTATFPQGVNTIFPNTLRIDNRSNVSVFVKASTTAQSTAATANDYEVAANAVAHIDVGTANDFVSVFPQAAATGPVYLSRGIGKN